MIRLTLAMLALLGLAACGGSPPTRYYTLMPERSAPTGPVSTGPARVISVGPVTVPAALDQAPMVRNQGQQSVDVLDGHRWQAPLKDELTAALVARLRTLLSAAVVADYTQSAAQDEDIRLLLDVTRFELGPGDQAVIEALWTVKHRDQGPIRHGRVRRAAPVVGSDMAAWAAAAGRALDSLAHDLVPELK